MSWKGLGLALTLVLLTNVFVLIGVARNRSGKPEAVIEITERELWLSRSRKENSGISLSIRSNTLFRYDRESNEGQDWFDRKKLEDLGFDYSTPLEDPGAESRYEKVLPRETFAVLEFGGKAWEDWLAGEERLLGEIREDVEAGDRTLKQLEIETWQSEARKKTRSRLFIVDAGKDPGELRRRYPDRNRYLILPAVARLRLEKEWNAETDETELKALRGTISEILVNQVHVPLRWRTVLESIDLEEGKGVSHYFPHFPGAGTEQSIPVPRYTVTLRVGKRHEPWVAGIRLLESAEVNGES